MIMCPPSLSWAETSLDIQTVRQGGSLLDKYSCHACCPGWQWRNRSRGDGGDLHVGLHILLVLTNLVVSQETLQDSTRSGRRPERDSREGERERDQAGAEEERERGGERGRVDEEKTALWLQWTCLLQQKDEQVNSGQVFRGFLFKNIFRLVDKEMRVKKALKALKVRV